MEFKNLSWTKIIIFALITGVYTGVMCLIPVLKETSFHDIAVTYEWWILFAVIIVMGCDRMSEASLKTFVFFLISQPLVYLIQVPFNSLGWGIFAYYKYWAVITFLTLPGAAIAFLVKRKDVLSAVVLSVATGMLAYLGVTYMYSCIYNFPYHLLTTVFCFALIVWLVLKLLPGKRERIIAFAITAAAIAVTVFFTFVKPSESSFSYPLDESMIGREIDIDIEDSDLIRVEVQGESLIVYAAKQGETKVTLTDETGNVKVYNISVGAGKYTDISEAE